LIAQSEPEISLSPGSWDGPLCILHARQAGVHIARTFLPLTFLKNFKFPLSFGPQASNTKTQVSLEPTVSVFVYPFPQTKITRLTSTHLKHHAISLPPLLEPPRPLARPSISDFEPIRAEQDLPLSTSFPCPPS
jgi:hypothetical protein